MSRNSHQKQGFSLLEIMVASAIGAVVLLAAIEFFMRQQNVFKQQSEQAARQADLRIAIYYLNKDLINAGYTGTPYGLQAVIYNTIANSSSNPGLPSLSSLPRPVRPVFRSEYTTLGIPNNLLLLDGKTTDPVVKDAVKIWANFNSEGAVSHLLTPARPGDLVLFGSSIGQNFTASFWDTAGGATVTVLPLGFVIGKKENKGFGEYHTISSVSGTSNTITANTSIATAFTGPTLGKPGDTIAPIWERIYYINYCADNPATGPYQYDRCLIRRDVYRISGGGSYTRQQDVARVYDLQIRYDVLNPNVTNAPIIEDVDANNLGGSGLTQFDPCWIIGIRLYLQAIISAPANPAAGSPLKVAGYIKMSRYVPTKNVQMKSLEWDLKNKPLNGACPCL